MRKYLLLVLLMCGCMGPARESAAKKAVEAYVKTMLDNPHYLEPVSFTGLEKKRYITPLDSSLNYAGIKEDDYKKMEQFIDSENAQRPDISTRNLKDLDDIKRGKLDYYTIIYSFRIDSGGHKKLKRYKFELDSANNILNARDITFTAR